MAILRPKSEMTLVQKRTVGGSNGKGEGLGYDLCGWTAGTLFADKARVTNDDDEINLHLFSAVACFGKRGGSRTVVRSLLAGSAKQPVNDSSRHKVKGIVNQIGAKVLNEEQK